MPRRLPKNVHSEVTRHGVRVYYFRRDGGSRVRLPSIDSLNFGDRYADAVAGRPVPHVRNMPISPAAFRKQRVEAAMVAAITRTQARSKKLGRGFDLTLDWLLDKAEEQDFRCLLTGIEFYAEPPNQGRVHPYAPSLDRIEPSRGYTQDNVRIVIWAVNAMLLDWGPRVFEQVANSYRYWQRNGKRKPIPSPIILAPAPEKIS
jgi:hypothetical protein